MYPRRFFFFRMENFFKKILKKGLTNAKKYHIIYLEMVESSFDRRQELPGGQRSESGSALLSDEVCAWSGECMTELIMRLHLSQSLNRLVSTEEKICTRALRSQGFFDNRHKR